MDGSIETRVTAPSRALAAVPEPVLSVFRGVGQVFFQENAESGVCFLVGIAAAAPLAALGGLIGSLLGMVSARVLRFDRAEVSAGIYGFNAALVGIASFVFFAPGAWSVTLMAVGCVVSTPVTYLMRRFVPWPTYTTPFIVITWALLAVGTAFGLARTAAGEPLGDVSFAVAAAHGIGQVMFQASVWTAAFFVAGIAIGDWRHALWVVAAAVLGTLTASFHLSASRHGLDPEMLVERGLGENIALGLYGYNATLAAIALFLARRSFIPPLLGIVLTVPLTEYFPLLGVSALTAPFVTATWIVLALGWLETKYFSSGTSKSGG